MLLLALLPLLLSASTIVLVNSAIIGARVSILSLLSAGVGEIGMAGVVLAHEIDAAKALALALTCNATHKASPCQGSHIGFYTQCSARQDQAAARKLSPYQRRESQK